MLVKILDADSDFVETLKRQTRTNTASKAFLHAANQYQHLRLAIGDLEILVEALQMELKEANEIIEGARTAAALLLDRVSQ
ncbi:hypothetical protein [Pseudomonas sp. P116]|uniref:hypothetical protein n=1 Tax=Pseudomonas sp. P116 TaxID=2710581 RepID=UPI001CCDE8D9|nr:hypothetical protein [Pseudomonas sp. P116]MBZ9566062.1 hypothetical protein [Pseudomonas sp. P116]